MNSIRFKLWSGMMALVLVVLVLLWFFQIVFLQSFYSFMHVKDIRNKAESLVKLVDTLDGDEFKDRLEDLAYNNNLSIEMLDASGKTTTIAGSTGGSGQLPMVKNSARAEAFQDVMNGEMVQTELAHPRFGNQFMLLGLPVMKSGILSGAMLINLPLAPVVDTVSILKVQLLFISVLLLISSIAISYLMSRNFTRKILEIQKASERMAAGDFDVRVNFPGKDEVDKLGQTLNNMSQQLSRIEQLRRDIIANVSHDLRTPLSIIRGYAETIRDVTGDSKVKRDQQLGIMIEEVERLSNIVEDILNLSQLQTGNAKMNYTKFSLGDTLEEILRRHEVMSVKTGVNLQLITEGNTELEGDEGRISQAVYNLIGNAFSHVEAGGTITVSALEKDDRVRLEVADTGCGISKEDLSHIWERYYKADNRRSREGRGAGLGLAIVKSVMEAHQADFGVASELGSGTTFWFEFHKK